MEPSGGQKIKVVDTVALQWRELARSLGFGQDSIDCIADMYMDDCEACCEMLAKWLEGNENFKGPVTWKTFIQCLIGVGQVELARELGKALILLES